MLTPSLIKWVAGFTILFGLPLYFTKLIRETRFPEGVSFVFVFTWGLIAVVALPIFLLLELYFLIRGLQAVSVGSDRRSLFITAFAFCFGLAAECVFLLVRR